MYEVNNIMISDLLLINFHLELIMSIYDDTLVLTELTAISNNVEGIV